MHRMWETIFTFKIRDTVQCTRENIFSEKEIHKTSSAILYVINRMREEIFLEEDINKTYNMDRMQLKIVVILYLQGE